MRKLFTSIFILVLMFSFTKTNVFAQGSTTSGISGKIVDEYDEPLIGATVIIKNTTIGATTDLEGNFEFNTESGKKEIVISFLGYDSKTLAVDVKEGEITKIGIIILKGSIIGLGSIDIVADRARERETPVALSNISKTKIEEQLGSRDIPMLMNITPSVYATVGGGGAGDARINVRGFNQNNVAIMINGVPINDMENGWVYWSNWDGIADATSSIQMQRGLSAVNLATPSVGGTMNIITNPAEHKAGGSAKFEYGSGNFIKTTFAGNSGLINDKYAVSASLVRKVGQGVIDKTWTDAWAYYFGASYILNETNRIEIYAIGAPQRHGQNLYKQNVAVYDQDYAKEIGVDDSTLMKFVEQDRFFNQNWGTVSKNYKGEQNWNGKSKDRYSSDFINERENFYNKPLVNLNWYSQWSEKLSQFTTIYYSGGEGGGTGTYGSFFRRDADGKLGDDDYKFYYGTSPWAWDLDTLITINSSNDPFAVIDRDSISRNNKESVGIIRNSRNNQSTIGAISKVKIKFDDNLKGAVGVDWRKAKIEHYREVRDLLGGDYYVYSGNEFDDANNYNKVLGDRIAYNFTNTVDWFGYFGQLEYSNEKITAYTTFGQSFLKYTYTNHFVRDTVDTSKELFSETDQIIGLQVKGGISYRPMDVLSVFGNYGYISKAPIFDDIIDDRSGTVADDPKNQKFKSFEFGAIYSTLSRNLNIKANYYSTYWTDRAMNIGIEKQDGTEGFIFVSGMDQLHTGVEFETNYKPIYLFEIGAMASFGNWKYVNNVKGEYKDYDGGEQTEEYNFYVKDLKVGDAPQTQFAVMLNIYPIKGLRLQFDSRHYSNHYAEWNPFSRTDETDKDQVWKTPSYMLFDFHTSYVINFSDFNLEIFCHIFNLFDEMYIQDAVDNSSYNGFYGYDNRFSHTVNSAEVFLGLPRTFNAGIKINL
ncbi:MAG: TonB-dependent receptor [Bacteroidales bacterium]|nr:TonB-dependent receptor [Bacteroidales bacterium]